MISEIKTSPFSQSNLGKALDSRTGLSGISVSIDNFSWNIKVPTYGEYKFDFIKIDEEFDTLGYIGMGAILSNSKGTQRFFRARLCNTLIEPFFQWSSEPQLGFMKDKTTDEVFSYISSKFKTSYYVMNIWNFLADTISYNILKYKKEWLPSFLKEYSAYSMEHFELIQNPWGPVIMCQELKFFIPEVIKSNSEVDFPYWTDALENQYDMVCSAFQKKMLTMGFNLSGTSKNDPGSVATYALPSNFTNKTTALGEILTPVSCIRFCRVPREARGLRAALEFVCPERSLIRSENNSTYLSTELSKYLTTLTIAIFDCPQNVAGDTTWYTDEALSFNGLYNNSEEKLEDSPETPEWVYSAGSNKDKILITKDGKPMIAITKPGKVTLTEEQFLAMKEKLELKKNFEVVSTEVVHHLGYCSKQITVSWDSTEDDQSDHCHVKLVFPAGAIKGITETVDVSFIASHSKLTEKELSTPKNLLRQRKVLLVHGIIAATTIVAKKAEVALIQGTYERIAFEENSPIKIPSVSQDKWISKDRTADVSSEDYSTLSNTLYCDMIDNLKKRLISKGQNPEGYMWLYIDRQDGLGYVPYLDTDRKHLQCNIVRNSCLRTRHGDSQEIGGDTKCFAPVLDVKTGGIKADINTAALQGSLPILPSHFQNTLNELFEAGKQLHQFLKPQTSDIEEYVG